MTEETVKVFLRYPSKPLVDFALAQVNLSWQEERAVDLCGRKRMTQEKAAEMADCSVDSMQRWYRAGIGKLVTAWADSDWINKVVR